MDEALESTLVTLRDAVRWAASRFSAAGLAFGHGTDNALDEAYALVSHVVSLAPGVPEPYLDARLHPQERRRIVELVDRRIASRKPLPYLTGEAWFAGLPFHVDERVLVPRSPIAELIERRFEPWAPPTVGRILDIGTGCGCIAVTCALAFPRARVDAVDVDEGALALARRNAARHGVAERVEVLRSDLYAALAGRRYDIIVSNPPYVPEGELAKLPAEYGHEPRHALASGPEGLDHPLRILHGAAAHLGEGGILVMEVGATRPALEAHLPGVPVLWVELERGGEGVLLLTAEALTRYHAHFEAALAEIAAADRGGEGRTAP